MKAIVMNVDGPENWLADMNKLLAAKKMMDSIKANVAAVLNNLDGADMVNPDDILIGNANVGAYAVVKND